MSPASERDADRDHERAVVDGQRALERPRTKRPYQARSAQTPRDAQQSTDDAAGQRHHAGFGEVLPEDVAAARAERAPHAGDRRGVQELRQQQPDGVHQADREECERHDEHRLVVVADDLVALQPAFDVVEVVVERPREAARASSARST